MKWCAALTGLLMLLLGAGAGVPRAAAESPGEAGLEKGAAPAGVALTYAQDLLDEKIWAQAALREAFSRYWTLRQKGDFEGTFALEAPYFREMVPFGRYRNYLAMQSGNTKIQEIVLVHVAEKSAYCYDIGTYVKVVDPAGKRRKVTVIDRWVQAGGAWYHVIRNPMLFPETG